MSEATIRPDDEVVRWHCSSCGQKLKYLRSSVGQTIQCPQCGEPSSVPVDLATAAPETHGQKEEDQKLPKRIIWISIFSGCAIMLVIVFMILFFHKKEMDRLDAERATAKARTRIEAMVTEAKKMIAGEQYARAKEEFEQALALAKQSEDYSDLAEDIKWELEYRGEIKYGAKGMVKFGRKWYAQQEADRLRSEWNKTVSEVDAQRNDALKALENKEFQAAIGHSDSALDIIRAAYDSDHPKRNELSELRSEFLQLRERAAHLKRSKEMHAKGLVSYKNRWVTPEEKFDSIQRDKGLVKYNDRWVTKEEKFAEQQKAKGLVEYKGKWMTSDQKMQAQGYVQFEGKWVVPKERDRILAEREDAEKDRKRKAAEKAKKEKERKLALERKKLDAYLMSQTFIKKVLKAPSTAVFVAYTSPEVSVTVDENGKYTVMAPIEAKNLFGVPLRKAYMCVLWPTGGDYWQSSLATILE